MTDDTDIIDMFDHLCWYLCSTRESFVPPEETAEKSLEGMDGMWSKDRMVGYHHGNFVRADEVIDFLEMYDIDVEERARAYVDKSDNDIDPTKSRDELKAILADE